ncbi:MAG: DUF4250 domain-containing protein [Tissierellia bacterium]|nr:DUF4250 domain-containing protein [Tissierellia bacterium]
MNLDLTMDPNILVSIVNMKLRNDFDDIDDLVKYYDITKEELDSVLGKEEYFYCESKRQYLIK